MADLISVPGTPDRLAPGGTWNTMSWSWSSAGSHSGVGSTRGQVVTQRHNKQNSIRANNSDTIKIWLESEN